MSRPVTDRSDAALRARLRAGDPLAGAAEREAQALARIARRLAAIAPPSPRRSLRFSAFLPAAAAALVVVALGLAWRAISPTPPAAAPQATERPLGPPAPVGAEAAESRRQLQFETPGGTRVVWLLDPDLTL